MPWCRISSSGPKFPGCCFTGTYRGWTKKENLSDKNDNKNILNSDVIFEDFPHRAKNITCSKVWLTGRLYQTENKTNGMQNREEGICS